MKVKFAIAGCGAIGSRHAAVIDAEPRAEIVAFCDVDSTSRDKLRALYGHNVPVYSDYSTMIRETDADLITVCTPHALHAPMAIEAANVGKHILVEKPMALTTRDAEEMMSVALANSVQLMVVKQNRYNVPISMAKKALDSGKIGRVFMVKCDVLWNRHDGYYKDSNWRGRKALEGGALYTQASHFIDLMNWWFGNVVSAEANIDRMNHDIEIEDCGTAFLQFETGVMGSLTWTTCVYNKNYEGSITIIGEYGTIKIGGQYLNKIEYWDVRALPFLEGTQFNDKPNLYGKYQGTSSNHDRVVGDVVASLLQEHHNVVEGDEGIMSIRAIEMIYENCRKKGQY